MRKIRVFIDQPDLKPGKNLIVKDGNHHYLSKVMRLKIGDEIEIFNGKQGDFKATTQEINKKSLELLIVSQIKQQETSSPVTLAFAPVKNVGIDFIAKKATELDIGKFQPIITRRTIVDKINNDRFKANVKEACEQCERNSVPVICDIIKLEKFLEQDFENKILILCDESLNGQKASSLLAKIKENTTKDQEIIIFIGPEGGFSQNEFDNFDKLKNINKISLGKRILRADTAIISALALVNEFLN